MKKSQRFLISYICDNHPNTLEISSDKDSLNREEALEYIKLANVLKSASITDIRIVGLHRPNNPNVHPGHYQQPEG
ncbi:MAG: hypothetical protein Q7T48_21810 [Cellvibrio sp.]|uniref:hypothetical protein n=1 Tax=Cellvibrio sp. TaxID=1965322 RepID=UPI00271BE7D3|nr:hypothetical protein [Cellvibrio sp.]